jgi:competence protein ComEA
MALPRGMSLLLGLLMLLLGIRYGREVLPSKEEPPAFSCSGQEACWLGLGKGFPRPGVHQFIDGESPKSVISMALGVIPLPSALERMTDATPETGTQIDLETKDGEIVGFSQSWMPASQRLVLGIPLRPDTMSEEDWQALPGIGPKLAHRIVEDRQKNGGFASLEDLGRVSGIGPGRIRAWRKYF